MLVRLGYAVISKTLEAQKLFRTLTYTNYLKEGTGTKKLEEIILHNLNGLEEILKYNVKNNIHFYRLSSSLIPLATHNNVDYDYESKIKDTLQHIGSYINANNLRIDTHPDQYCVLNSVRNEVVLASIQTLKYEASILNMLKIKKPLIILHVGSSEGGKEEGIKRFKQNFLKLDNEIKKMIAIENDDKVYNIKDTLSLCEDLEVPMILDYHHHICNNDNLDINTYLPKIFATWQKITPKIHFSSPKSKLKRDFRAHHDYINVQDFIAFMQILKKFNQDVDIMIEAKMKDEALFRLVRELKYLTNYNFLDDTSFII